MIIGDKHIGYDKPCFMIGEIGINHNGDVENVKKIIDLAVLYGFDAVKFQKRDPELCVPDEQKNLPKETPWGNMTYLEYKKRMEFDEDQYREIDEYCKEKGIIWFASPWDIPSVDFLEKFNPPCYKVASALLTDKELLLKIKSTGKPIILSTGMSTLKQVEDAVKILGEDIIILHCNSSYPAKDEELNLKFIPSLIEKYKNSFIGYSGHESGVTPSVIAVAYGACVVERHITLNRTMWGTDQAASLESRGMELLVREIRRLPVISGDGIKKVYDSEVFIMKKLRKN